MKLLNNYIIESGNNRNFGKTSRKEQSVVYFTQTQYNDAREKKKSNSKGDYNCFHCGNQHHWAVDYPNLESE